MVHTSYLSGQGAGSEGRVRGQGQRAIGNGDGRGGGGGGRRGWRQKMGVLIIKVEEQLGCRLW